MATASTSFTAHQHNTIMADQVGLPNRYRISLPHILYIALGIRIIAALFSRGFAFHDDHFDVISIAQDWVYGVPSWINEDMPPRHSMFYTLIHAALFYFCDFLGFTSPDGKMTLVRLLHGIYSVFIVYFGYKITERLSGKRDAQLVGLMLALVWFMPFMSVRNLVEMVCIPPFLAAFYLIIKEPKQTTVSRYLWAGALFALAFVFRYHTILLAGGVGLVLLYQKQFRAILLFGIGFLVVAFLIQGTIDLIFFDYPFHSVVTYFLYNTDNANSYSSGPVYRFLLTILGFLVPPVSVFLLVGYARTARLAPILFWGGFIFFVAHSLFPNKQERFILPLFPVIMILGVIGWQNYVRHSGFWQKRQKLLSAIWIFFWSLNILAALGMAFTYSKKSRIAPLVYLSQKPNADGIILDFGKRGIKPAPVFYLGHNSALAEDYKYDYKNKWQALKNSPNLPQDFVMVYSLNDEKPLTELAAEMHPQKAPDYVVMVGQDNLGTRLARLRTLYPGLRPEQTINPSLYDQLLHFLNPRVHKDEHVRIFQII